LQAGGDRRAVVAVHQQRGDAAAAVAEQAGGDRAAVEGGDRADRKRCADLAQRVGDGQ